MSYTLDELRFLRDTMPDIQERCADLQLSGGSLVSDVAELRAVYGDYGRAAAELVQAQRSGVAAGKFPGDWLVCHDSAQQATPRVVAEARAQRIVRAMGEGSIVHDVTCSVGTEGAALLDAGLRTVGSDLDPVRCTMAAWNLRGRGALITRADALRPSSRAEVIVADPARRHAGRRITSPRQLIPPLPDVVETYRGREMAIKCAPGLDYSFWEGLVSVVSVDGGVKEACLYTPGLGGGARREAIILRQGRRDHLDDRLPDEPERDLAGEPGTWIIDPDGAIVRAGLVRHYAVREGLWMLDERIAYLTGDHVPAGTSGFRVLETCPVKKVRQVLQRRDCGRVEILCRGVDIDPDRLRRSLKLKGSQSLGLVLTRQGRSAVAIVCGPRTWAEEGPSPRPSSGTTLGRRY